MLPAYSRFVAIGNNAAYTSNDGITWSAGFSGAGLGKIAFGNGIFVALPLSLPTNHVYYSSNGGLTWNLSNPFTSASLQSISFGGGTFIAVGGNTTNSVFARFSTDGINWSDGSGLPVSTNNTYSGIAYDDVSRFVTVGSVLPLAVVSAFSDNDGATWSTGGNPGNTLNSLTYGKGLFVGVAVNNDLYWSNDRSLSWILASSPVALNLLYDVDYGNGNFVTVGQIGEIDISSDGDTWINAGNFGTNDFRAVTHGNINGNLRFVAVGDNNSVYYSDDNGVSWTVANISGGTNFTSIAYGLVQP